MEPGPFTASLTIEELNDLKDRWWAWFQDSDVKTLSRDELMRSFLGWPQAPTGSTVADFEKAFSTMFQPPESTTTPLVQQVIELAGSKIPELQELFSATPVLNLPVLEYQAFVNSLQSGRQYVGLSMFMLTQPFLIAEPAAAALNAVFKQDQGRFKNAANKLIVCAWHLDSLNHELLTHLTRGKSFDLHDDRKWIQMAFSMIAFQLMHECAHVFLCHHPTRDPDRLKVQELEADRQATRWWYKLYCPREHWDGPVYGLETFFRTFALRQTLIEKQSYGYPTWSERLKVVEHELQELGVATDYMQFAEGVFAGVSAFAQTTIVFSKDVNGQMHAYSNPAGVLAAVNGIEAGLGSITMIVIGPDGKRHVLNITPESLQEFVQSGHFEFVSDTD